MPRLKDLYRETIIPAMMERFSYGNVMEVPRLEKIVVNIGAGEALLNAKALDAAAGDLGKITGQRAIITRARKSIAAFRLRAGNPIGAKVTLRGERMYSFLDRLISVALPRQRDFSGVPRNAFDGRGNYTLGLKEQLLFLEIEYDSIDKVRGLEVTVVTSAKTDEEARYMLQLFGLPFANA
jgi:large subunit ribosomal protein L5